LGLIDSIIGAESGGDNNAKNPNSSASGPGQFIDSTFLDVIRKARPDLADKPDSELLALKTDPVIGRQATEAYAAQNGETLSKNGLPVTPGNTYLAHFAGPTGAVNLLKADPTTPRRILDAPAIKANPFLRGMTAADLQGWAAKKMGGAAPQSQPAPASPAAPPSAPLNIAPQTPPIFAAPTGPTATAASQAGGLFESMPQMQAPPIFYAQRRSPDLSKLRAAFQAPVFPPRIINGTSVL
jgi:hypothetical protein